MKKKEVKKGVVIYQAKNGAIELRGDTSRETLWATQVQIASAFDVSIPTINEHLKNIYKTNELSQASTIRNFRIVQMGGNLCKKCNSSNGHARDADSKMKIIFLDTYNNVIMGTLLRARLRTGKAGTINKK